MPEAHPTPICPRCDVPLTFYEYADKTGGVFVCETPLCPNAATTVTTLLDERGRPTNMRGWRAGLNKKGKRP